jgi:hypothetical protein
MRKRLISAVICILCLLGGPGKSLADKKAERAIQERFTATDANRGDSLTVAIQGFSTDEEMQSLAQIFAQQGEGALQKALGKVKKGFFVWGNEATAPLVIVQSQAEGSVRRLQIVGKAPTVTGEGEILTAHPDYPYTFIQLEVDEKGNGKGMLIPFGKLLFNDQGRMVLKPMSQGAVQLVHVHHGM